MINEAEAIAVGGGNTFHLVAMMHQTGIMEAIKGKAERGTPYMGWSAGANVACPTLKTTNDMPIIEPASFETLNLVPFQINPHYLDANPEGHGGETRQQRNHASRSSSITRCLCGHCWSLGIRISCRFAWIRLSSGSWMNLRRSTGGFSGPSPGCR